MNKSSKIYINGNIYSLDKKGNKYSYLAVHGDRISDLGNEKKDIKSYGTDVEIIDLKGKTIVPGFNDSHMHLFNCAYNKRKIILNSYSSIEEIIEAGKGYNKNYSWILGRGWNQDLLMEQRMLEKKDLDKISLEKPVCFTRVCGHVVAVNSKALEICGITRETKVVGGDIDFDRGILSETAIDLVNLKIEDPSFYEIKEMIREITLELNRVGITSVQTDDFENLPSKDFRKIIEAYLELERENNLSVRIYEQGLLPRIDRIKDFLKLGLKTGMGSTFFRMGPIKLLIDGSLGGKTALLTEPYLNSENRGIAVYNQKELNEIVSFADTNDFQIAIHAIGDEAMKMALESYKRISNIENKRNGIVHCQITNNNLIEEMKKFQILAYIQPIFLDYDLHIVNERVGETRGKESYAWNSMLGKNVSIAFGSDAPVETFDVIKGIHCAVNRQDLNYNPKDGWNSTEKITVTDAIKAYTLGGAYASFEENEKGTLEIGKLADFVVLSDNIFEIDTQKILGIKVEKTILGGKIVYEIK